MKAKDLMINDYVLFNKIPLIIVSNMATVVWLEGEQGWFFNDEIEPVTITEAILKANGFSEQPNTPEACMDFVFSNEDGIRVYVTPEIGEIYSVHALFTGKIDMTIRYVHELQHILRLIGLDDLADNFKIK